MLPVSMICVNRKAYRHLFTMLCRATLTALAVAGSYAVGTAEAWDNDPVAHDIAAEIGLNFHGQQLAGTQGKSAVFDYDGDGLRDILLSTHGGSPWPLMQAQPDGTFHEILAGTFFRADRHGCVAADFGSIGGYGRPDGLQDLYCVTGACKGTCTKEYPNSLFIQRADHTFQDVARSWGVADVHGRGREPAVIDYDRDGLPDIVVANEGPSIYPAENRLFHNLGGSFAEVTNSAVRSSPLLHRDRGRRHRRRRLEGYRAAARGRHLAAHRDLPQRCGHLQGRFQHHRLQEAGVGRDRPGRRQRRWPASIC